jgi:muramoyltetrapeptide carboxypeptidase
LSLNYLKIGDNIGFIAPGGIIQREEIEESKSIFESKGFKVNLSDHLFGAYRYFSGTVKERLKDIHGFLLDPAVQGIYAVRGGMGCIQLLPYINYNLWKNSRKLLIGFSDVTILQWAVWGKISLGSFSGMVATTQLKQQNPYVDLFFRQITGSQKNITSDDFVGENILIAKKGQAEGVLMGGTLSMIISMLGTPYLPTIDQIILFIEDINEPIYRIERAMLQLKLAGITDHVKGIIFGRFFSENQNIDFWPALEYLLPEDIPVVLNMPYGHYSISCALPIGVKARLETNPFNLSWD